MSNAVWKLTSLAGIVGIGLLVVMNAQRELKDKLPDESPGSPVAELGGTGTEPALARDTATEPRFGPEGFADEQPTPARAKTQREPTPVADPDDDFRLGEQNPPRLAQNSRKGRLDAPPANLEPLPGEEPGRGLDEEPPLRTGRPRRISGQPSMEIVDLPAQEEPGREPSRIGEEDSFPGGDRQTLPEDPLPEDPLPEEPSQPEPLTNEPPPADSLKSPSRLPDDDDVFGRPGNDRAPAMPADDPDALEPVPTPVDAGPTPNVPDLPAELEPEPEPVPTSKAAVPPRMLDDEDARFGLETPQPVRSPGPPGRRGPGPDVFNEVERTEGRVEPDLGPAPAPMPAIPARSLNDDDDFRSDRKDDPDARIELPTDLPSQTPPLPESPLDKGPSLKDDPDESIRVRDNGPDRTAIPDAVNGPQTSPPIPAAGALPPLDAAASSPANDRRDPIGPPPMIEEDEVFLTGPRSGDGARVDLVKTAPTTAMLGQPMTYQINVRNTGTARAAQVVVEDRVPRGVELESCDPQADLIGNRLIWKLGGLDAGETRRISVRVVPRSEGKIGTVAMVKFASSNAAETLVASPRLKFELLGPPQAMLGSLMTFRFRVTNLGSMEVRKVFIESKLPPGLTHPDGDVLSCEVGTLAPGKSDEIPLQLTAARQGPSTYKAVVTADGGVSVETAANFEIVGANFQLTRTGDKRTYLGRSTTYVNEIYNSDSRPVFDLSIVEKVPAGMKFVNASAGGRYDPVKREILWQIRRVEPGERIKVNVTLTTVDRGAQTATVRAFDKTAMAIVDFVTNGSGVSGLTIDMSDPDTPQVSGDTFDCRVRVINRGSDRADDVRVTIVLPKNVRLVDAKGLNFRENRGALEFEPSFIDSRQEATIDLKLQAREPGEARIQTLVTSDRITDPLRSEEITTIVVAGE